MPRTKTHRLLAIETSCDETALALVRCSGGLTDPRFVVEHDAVASQIAIHAPFGGVVPNLAKREHLKNLPVLFRKLFGNDETAEKTMARVDALVVTVGPGLEPSLWTGIEFAKDLAKRYKKPLIGANHLEGHLYSFLLAHKKGAAYRTPKLRSLFPGIGLIVSGGHTTLLRLESLTRRVKLGETRDDAVGEAFDKVARVLGLPYPGGPEIERAAQKGNAHAVPFPRPMIHDKNLDFSYSGLKTSVLYYHRDHPRTPAADLAASFQEAALDVLVAKTARALREARGKALFLSGGVAANKALREKLSALARKENISFLVAEFTHNTDNAVMIAVAGYLNILTKKKYPLRADGAMNIKSAR